MVLFTNSFALFALAFNRLCSCLSVFPCCKSSYVRVNSACIRIHSFYSRGYSFSFSSSRLINKRSALLSYYVNLSAMKHMNANFHTDVKMIYWLSKIVLMCIT